MELLVLGISHNTAPVALRERLALTERAATRFMTELVARDEVDEAVAISTCNRTEIYLVTADPVRAEAELLGKLARRADIRPTELAQVVYSPRNCDAARQLYRVTAGLDSMIVGEAEVQGQVRRAYEAALEAGTTGPMTNRLFGAALQAGKRVRSETGIARERVSISSVAVDLARDVVGDLESRSVVIIGAGETAELTAQALVDQGVRTVFVANRHADRARSLADRFGGEVGSLESLPARLQEADIVVSSTSSPHPIVEADDLAEVMRVRDGRPLVLIDIAVPRDIEHACGELDGVSVYDMDDLQAVVRRNLSVREAERSRADAVVEEEIQRFARWLAQLDVMPTIASLREHGAEIVDQVLAENAGRWETLSPRDLARVEAVARAVMQRLLHEPTIRLKESGHGRQQVLRELFGLDEGGRGGAGAVGRDGARGAGGRQRPPAQAPGVRIGTRGSALALAQARQVAKLLDGGEHELVEVVTSGDRGEAVSDKERWVRELDAALLDGAVDCAVHSAKDVPAQLPEGIVIAAVPPRADPRDALCGAAALAALAAGARVGTSSLRRAAQVRALRDDLAVVDLRGNVDTRLRKLEDGDYDAIVLAAAGLERLGRGDAGTPLEELVPASGQGCLAVTTRAGEESLVAAIDDPAAARALAAERALVRALEADCHTPVGAHAEVLGSDALRLRAFVGAADGSAWVRDELDGADPERLGAAVAQRLLSAGAREVLAL